MSFHHSSLGAIFDPGFSSPCDERFSNVWFPPDHHRSFHTYPPNLGSVSSQNIGLNYCPTSQRNVPYSIYSADICRQLPYANHSLLPSRIPCNPWANVAIGETFVPKSPEYCSRFVTNSLPNCYTLQRNLTMPDPVSSLIRPDHDYRADCNAGFTCGPNQHSSNNGFINYGSMITSHSQHTICQPPGYRVQNNEVVNSRRGDGFSLSPSFSIDDIMRNTAAASGQLACGNRNTLGIQSSVLDENYVFQPTFGHYSPVKELYAAGQNFEASGTVDMFSRFDIVDYLTANKPEAMNPQSLIEIPSFSSTRQMVRDYKVSDGGATSGQAECQFSPPGMVTLSVNGTQVDPLNATSASAHQSVCQAVSEPPVTREEPVIFTPSTDTFDGQLKQSRLSACSARRQLFSTQSTCSSRESAKRCVGISSAVVGSMAGSEIAVSESETAAVSEAETRTSLAESGGDAVAADTSAASNAVHFGNCHSPAQTSHDTQLTCGVNSALAISSESVVMSRSAAGSQKPTPEVTETTESEAVSHDESRDDVLADASDDVIVLSPLPTEHEPIAPITMDTQASTVKCNSYRRQPSCIVGNQTTDDVQLRSILCPNVPNSLPVSLSHAGSHTVRVPHGTSSQSVPLTSHNFVKFRNCDVRSSRAKHVIGQNNSVQTDSRKRHLSHHAISCIPRPSQQQSADSKTCSYVKPTFSHPPVTGVPNPIREEHSCSLKLKQLLHFSQSFQQDKLPKPGAAGDNSQCIMLDSNQQTPMLQSVASSVASAASASQRTCSTFSSPLSHIPPAVRPVPVSMNPGTNAVGSYCQRMQRTCPDRNQTADHRGLRSVPRPIVPKSVAVVGRHPVGLLHVRHSQSHSQPVFKHVNSALQFHGMSARRNGTYSVRAANVLLQQLKQAKLWDFASARAARRQLLSRRLSLLPQSGDVIDLTADDNDVEEDAIETCEFIFARTRRSMTSLSNLRRLQQNFFRRNSVTNVPSCYSTHQPNQKQTFAVDKSLPFYQCFVQKLLRNYRFTSAGTPVTVYPEFRPQAPPSVSCGSKDDRKPANSPTCEELVKKKQPVVLLEKLDQSLVSKSGTVNLETVQSGGVHASAESHTTEAENCVHVTSANVNCSQKFSEETSPKADVSMKVTANGRQDDELVNPKTLESAVHVASHRSEAENCVRVTRTSANNAQKCSREGQTETETNPNANTNVSANLAPNRQRSELISLCPPVSVVLERLDRIKIRQICKELRLRKTKPFCHDKRQITQLGTESTVSDLSWTAIQVLRSDKVPKLVIRASSPLTRNASQNKVAKKTCRMKSALKCLRTRSYSNGIRHLRSLSPATSEFNRSCERTVKSKSACQKLRFQSSVLMSLRSRNCAGHTLRCRYSAPVKRPPPQISPKFSRKQSQLWRKLLTKRAEIMEEINLLSKERCYVPEGVVTFAKQDLTAENTSVSDLLPHDSVLNCSSPQNSVSSDSDTVEFSPDTVMDVDASDDQDLSVPENLLSTDVLPYNSVLNHNLPENSVSSESDAVTVELSPYTVMDVDASDDQDLYLVPSDSIPENASSADIMPCDSTFGGNLQEVCAPSLVNTVELSPCSVMNVNFPVNLHVHSVPSKSVPENVQSADLQPCETACNSDVPDNCESSDSDTVVFSQHSSMDDLTVVYRSPSSDITFDLDALLLDLDEHEEVDGSLEAGNSSRKSDVYSDEELRPPSYLDYDRVISQPYPTDVSGSVQFLSNSVEISASSESLSCGLLASVTENSRSLQSSAEQHTVSHNLSEFMDNKGPKNSEVAGPSPLKLSQ